MASDDILDNTKPIDMDNVGDYEPLLRNLQGNILKDHGRNLAKHIFLTFTAEPATVKKWLRTFATNVTPRPDRSMIVTSAWQQQWDAVAYRNSGIPGIPFLSLFLSASGYEYLELERKLPEESAERSFRNGMRSSGESLQDPPYRNWDDPNWKNLRSPQTSVHGMILIANDKEDRLDRDTTLIVRGLKSIAEHFIEEGKMLYQDGDTKKPREHFGYIDGISNPIFVKDELEKADGYQEDGRRRHVSRFAHWDPFAPLRLVLVRDPGGPPDEPCFGSYLVFRKLEQNVYGFHEALRQLSRQLNPNDPSALQKRAMGLVMGRFPNGTPITLQDREVEAPPFHNDFRFETQGGRCPIRGHIRRANPRGETREGIDGERLHRIVRRGITYGNRQEDFSDFPKKDVGLLFMCYQNDIASHFEHIQKEWCNWTFGLDTIIGQGPTLRELPAEAQQRNTEWPKIWANTDQEKTTALLDWPDEKMVKGLEFGRYVTLKGGEYFFAPSIPFLQRM
ncbi:MAG: hypothetical protein OJF50_006257 [Nitrospira sp.]|jgi:Dyp-type peroxidase family|nr:hypothetical protein [Nitrospira sp.]